MWTYTWDLHNRLIEVTQKNPVDRGTPVHVSYEYDGLNYRISRTGTDGSKTEYAYGRNGAVIVERTGSITRSYIYANGVIAGFVDTDGVTSETRYCVTDHQGSVEKIVNDEGKILWAGCYTAFGMKGGESVNRIEFTGMFTGKDIDPETGLTYHWNRWRSEDGSVWLSEDPARDGTNWYGYCGNNPVMFIDLNGLDYNGMPSNVQAQLGLPPNPTPKRDPSPKVEEPAENTPTNNNLYHYAGNNPVKYVDPTGRNDVDLDKLANLGNDIYSLPSIYELQFKELSKNTQSHINKLDPTIRNDAISMMYELKKEGYSVEIVSSYRSFEKQNSLYSLGRDENGKVVDESKVVTNAKGGQSVHNFKLAFDVEVYKKNDKGRVVKDWNFNGDNWKAVIAKGQEKGFESGSTWSSPYDPPHFQNTHGKTLSQLRQSQ